MISRSHCRYACIAGAAFLFMSGCSELSSNTQDVSTTKAAVASTAEAQAIIWSASSEKPEPDSGKACTGREAAHRVDVTELRSDSNWLYIDIAQHSTVGPDKRDGMAAEIYVLKDNCPVRAGHVSGTVWRNADRPSTLVTSLSELPDGDLQIAIKVQEAQTVFHVHKSGKTVRRTGSRDRVYPADPATGLPAYVAVVGEGECPKEAAL